MQYSFDEQVINPGLAILFEFPQFAGTNLYLSKNAPTSKDRGSTMTYILYYHNFGDTAAQNVVLEDTLPAEVEFVSASDSGSYAPGTRKVTWDIGSVAPGGHGSRTETVRILESVAIGTVILNNGRISTSNLEVRYDDNEAQAETRVTGTNLPPDVSVEPNNGGTTPSVVWHTPITFSYYSSCATSVEINIHINDGGLDITGIMTETSPDTWTFTTSFSRTGSATITYTISGCPTPSLSFNIYIDPAGYIYDADTGGRISGASVWLQRPDGQGGWENVPTGQTPQIMQPDVNPLITDANGQYQWDVIEGSYRVHVEASGYYPADSIVVSIPPPVTDLHVGLARIPGANLPPVADVNGPYAGDEGSPITFNGSGSYDPNDNVVSWLWDLDEDGSYETDATATNGIIDHTWEDDYSGNVSLKVTDSFGAIDLDNITVNVLNVVPIVETGPDQEVLAGDIVYFNGEFTDPGFLDTHTIEWAFGDGTTATETLTPTHIYHAKGVYEVTLKVTDDDEGVGTGAVIITVKPILANVTIEPETLNLKSKGGFTAFIRLPESYNIKDINTGTVICAGAPLIKGMVADNNKYIAKFDREDLRKDLPASNEVEMIVTGKVLYNGGYADFEGSDTIRVIDNGKS